MKRKAVDDGLEGTAKRQLMDTMQDLTEDSASHLGSDNSSTIHPLAEDHPTPPTDVTETSNASKSKRGKFPCDNKTIKCTVPDCPKTFNRPARLLAHLRSHNNERPYKCSHEGCDKMYTENKHLRQHFLSHTKEAKFVCGTCGKGFATGTRLRRHGLVHEGQERFKCRDFPPCTQSFRKHQTLQRHILKEHMGEKPFGCTQEGCGASYDTANSLKAHVERVHGELRFWCDECCEVAAKNPEDEFQKPVGFTTQSLLDQHIRHEHVNCIFCDIKFNGQYELEHHMEVYHSGLTVVDRKTIECTFPGCPKKFTTKSNMTTHYRTAHEVMRFVCGKVNTWEVPGLEDWNWTEEGCWQDFTSKRALEEHILFVHLGEQRPQTNQDRRSGATNILDEISGVADYERREVVCTAPGCNARFVRHTYLQNHMQADHPEHAKEIGLLGASEVPQLCWADNDEIGLEEQQQSPAGWAPEEANLMQLLDLDAAIDPNLLIQT